MRPIGIDLFAGAGGLSLGFEQAGFDVAAAVEIDPVHCAVHKFNFPNTATIPRSIQTLAAQDILEAARIGDRRVDCVFGGAPCQGFSLIGHRALDDPRNGLVRDYVRIVEQIEPRTFVFENVKGLTIGRHRSFLDELIDAFSRRGYVVRTPWRVLNAGHFGTPQNRERLILLGAQRGESLPQYPTPATEIPGSQKRSLDLPKGPTCLDALGDLPNVDEIEELAYSDSTTKAAFGELSEYAALLRCRSSAAWRYGYVREWDPAVLTSSARTEHTRITRRRFRNTAPGSVEPVSRFYKLSKSGVSNTLRAGTDGARGAFTSPRPIHYRYDRCITVREMARLHGFPDWFRFNATKWHGGRQIGNAVPPPLARAIACQVMAALGEAPARPAEAVSLGDPELLSLGPSGAARRFGVEPLPSRRDRKSGIRKRRQIDIERERSDELTGMRV